MRQVRWRNFYLGATRRRFQLHLDRQELSLSICRYRYLSVRYLSLFTCLLVSGLSSLPTDLVCSDSVLSVRYRSYTYI